mmetsp:Transcript_4901/g.8069  ORF Transcript_4901/g.8069 Transcript_4901/m.8069 type:complete len:133 (+) Transcript_4901:2208-2606(+)
MRSVRLPDPVLAAVAEETHPPPQVQQQPVQPQPQPQLQPQPQPQPQADEEAAVEMDDGGTEPYYSDHDAQDIDDSLFSHSEQVILNLHQENAEIRAQLNEAQRQIRLLRRLHRTQAELDGLSGRYWRSPASR